MESSLYRTASAGSLGEYAVPVAKAPWLGILGLGRREKSVFTKQGYGSSLAVSHAEISGQPCKSPPCREILEKASPCRSGVKLISRFDIVKFDHDLGRAA